MLSTENDWRLSKPIIDAYHMRYLASDKTIKIERLVQQAILREYGYADTDDNLAQYQQIGRLYTDDDEVMNSAFYLRLNIYSVYDIPKDGDRFHSDIDLISYPHNNKCNLGSLGGMGDRPLVILAGSLT
jgi:hypothetical protein